MLSQNITHIRELLEIYTRHKQILEKQLAFKGGFINADSALIVQLEEVTKTVEELKKDSGLYSEVGAKIQRVLEALKIARRLIEERSEHNTKLLEQLKVLVANLKSIRDIRDILEFLYCPYCMAHFVTWSVHKGISYECGCSLRTDRENLEEVSPCLNKTNNQKMREGFERLLCDLKAEVE